MKRHLFVFVFIVSIFPLLLSAQNAKEDVIYLKDGSIYRGTIIEQIPHVSYKIEIAGGSVIMIKAEDVEKVTFEKSNSSGGYYLSRTWPKPIFHYRKKGYFFEARATFPSLTGLSIINGYRFGQWAHLGIGVGIFYTVIPISIRDFQTEGGYTNIVLHYSGDILPKQITPFYSIQIGYGFNLQPNRVGNVYDYSGLIHAEGGIFGGIAFGCKIYAPRKKTNICFALNFDVQHARYWLKPDSYTYTYYSNRLSGYQILLMPGSCISIGF